MLFYTLIHLKKVTSLASGGLVEKSI